MPALPSCDVQDKKAPAVKADLPYIRCGVCEGIVKHSIAGVKKMKAEATPIKKVWEGFGLGGPFPRHSFALFQIQ